MKLKYPVLYFKMKIIYIKHHIFLVLKILTLYTSKNLSVTVEDSLFEDLWGIGAYRQSSCDTAEPPLRLILGKNTEYANILVCEFVELQSLPSCKFSQFASITFLLIFWFPNSTSLSILYLFTVWNNPQFR